MARKWPEMVVKWPFQKVVSFLTKQTLLETWNCNSSFQYFRSRQDRKTNSLRLDKFVLRSTELQSRQTENEKFLILNLWDDLCDNHFDWSKKLCQILLPNSRHPFYYCINLELIREGSCVSSPFSNARQFSVCQC